MDTPLSTPVPPAPKIIRIGRWEISRDLILAFFLLFPALLCFASIILVFTVSTVRSNTSLPVPAALLGGWARNPAPYALCDLEAYPAQLSFQANRSYTGSPGSLWAGGRFQVLPQEQIKLETAEGMETYTYILETHPGMNYLRIHAGICEVTYTQWSK
ncbi:hypothetical protein [Levilinea saccharolytica]|uniref:Uncharacterized protein n=1 Tax=Levilinea saccharolytica TaxID=229921 RepID=A0A0M8JPF1_9CHLR|nr:hypothetical protein [Levilinea saccharolytica]KPL91585.1 hypothetical protein ADN01_01325 [Levilinea saccharolytica]GAP19077.1 hypothetical protein LSAC_02975 [Levilinea saccharolytica]